MPFLRNTRFLLVVIALLIGGTVFVVASIQRQSADAGRDRQADTEALLTGMLDMETGFRGFALTGKEEFLAPYRSGRRRYERALSELADETSGEAGRRLETVDTVAQRWQDMALEAIQTVREQGKGSLPTASAFQRKAVFDEFRGAEFALTNEVESTRRSTEQTAAIIATIVALALALLIGFAGDLVIGRRERADRARRGAEARYRVSQAEFSETLQVAESEAEAQDLLRRHLERSIDDSQVVVFTRNNSQDRLEPATRIEDAGIAERVQGATPSSCLAVRLSRESTRVPGEDPLMACEICGATPGATTCRPLLVGHEVIGSVLVTHHEPLDAEAHERIRDSVAQASPALANLRNLRLAETRAETDSLTGLPNRRAIDATLKRMVAQSSRTMEPISALMIDLDHFKTINDLYGHEQGDEALAAMGALLRDMLRGSDFPGRQGGEEFIVLAPATDAAGAAKLAENLRKAVEDLQVTGLEHRLTASIGAATFPDVASNATGLVRAADRALYAAKERGRNRVEIAAAPARSAARND